MQALQFNSLQEEAIHHLDGPMMVLSVAGSGKTSVLTQRIVHLIDHQKINPYSLLAITFAKKAVLEILARLKLRLNGTSEKVTVATFHSLGYRILRAANYPNSGFRVIQNGEQTGLLSEAMSKAQIKGEPTDFLRRIGLAKNDLLYPSDLENSSKEDDQATGKVFTLYELLKRRRRLVDFDDLLFLSHNLLSNDHNLLNYYQQKYQFVLVDEFQDSSKVMVELVKLLSGQNQNLWLAGDDDQSIHSFRGARSQLFVSFADGYSNMKTITMVENYRCQSNILKVANNLICHNTVRIQKQMITSKEDGGEVQVLDTKDEDDEAKTIVDQVIGLKKKGHEYGEIAILCRVHKLMPKIEQALIENGIPHQQKDGALFNRPEAKAVISALRFLIKGEVGKGLDVKAIKKLKADLYPGSRKLSYHDAVELSILYVMEKFPPSIDEKERSLSQLYIDILSNMMNNHDNLIDFLNTVRQSTEATNQQRVNLMTIHQAKGLQFKAVIIPGVNESILPHYNSSGTIEQVEEERRLFYVALTRAMDHLTITYRSMQAGKDTLRSRFINEMYS
ncbi:MAG: ATP-dependent helicase [Deltaproteobacteria bacterium]|nr:ATP-dependent helicase [Deltaproteobacteria bacterium]MBF0523882.1 ATP-dependent helicase [Deltaproteobacteria bacterium]